jgi:tetratricopeptide (TPR) repeat protein
MSPPPGSPDVADKRLRRKLLDYVEQQTERAERARLSGTPASAARPRLGGVATLRWRVGDALMRMAGGDMMCYFGQQAIHNKRYYAAASYFGDAERVYTRARNEQPDRVAAARASRAWALANSGRLEQAVQILERLVADMSQLPQTEDARALWPGQTVGERRRWLDAQLRWALAQTSPGAPESN